MAIARAIDDVNDVMPEDGKVSPEREAPLFGDQGALDSVGLVNLIVAVEREVEDDFDVSIALADERTMSMTRSPFRTIAALSDHIMALLRETNGD